MTEPLVSIVVAIYNVEPFLDKCLDSILQQDYPELQIILVNDGSQDNSLKICEKYAAIDKRVQLINKDNGGVSSARNAGLQKAQGEFVCFVDGDDYLEKDMISQLVKNAGDHDLIMCDYFVDRDDRCFKESFLSIEETVFVKETDKIELMKNFFVRTSIASPKTVTLIGVPWAKLYRREMLVRNGVRFEESLLKMQDAIFNLDGVRHAGSIKYIHRNLYHYCQNDNSVTHRKNSDYEKISDALLKALKERIDRYSLSQLEPVYQARTFTSVLECLKFIYLLDDESTYFSRLKGLKRLSARSRFTVSQIRQFVPYLGKAQKLACCLDKAHMYNSLLIMSQLYLKRKNSRY